jgi:hypothetical protein
VHSILTKKFVRVDGDPPAALPRGAPHTSPRRCEKSVRPLKVERVVRALEVTCSCGEVTLVELDYDAPKE